RPPPFEGATDPAGANRCELPLRQPALPDALPCASALAFTSTDTLTFALMLAAASSAPLNGAATQAVSAAPDTGLPEAATFTAPCAPSTPPCTLAAIDPARSFMLIAILRIAGRFFSIAALYFAVTAASAEPSILSATFAGVHSSLPLTLASQLALHSALT